MFSLDNASNVLANDCYGIYSNVDMLSGNNLNEQVIRAIRCRTQGGSRWLCCGYSPQHSRSSAMMIGPL